MRDLNGHYDTLRHTSPPGHDRDFVEPQRSGFMYIEVGKKVCEQQKWGAFDQCVGVPLASMRGN